MTRISIGYMLFSVITSLLSFNWNHFEMRLLDLRINFLFIADFLSSSWQFLCCFFFHNVWAKFHLWPSSGDFTATSDRNAESCNRIPSNYCLP